MSDRNWEDNASLAISESSREVVAKLRDHNLLAIGKGESDLYNKDIYLLAVALGLDKPTDRMVKPESWTRTVNFSEKDKSLIITALMGTASSSDNISEFCDIKKAFDYCKQFTDAGFQKLDILAYEAMYDSNLMIRKMLDYVDSVYDDVVESSTKQQNHI